MGVGVGGFGRSGWRVEDGERKRRCCVLVGVPPQCGCQARPASPVHVFLLSCVFLFRADERQMLPAAAARPARPACPVCPDTSLHWARLGLCKHMYGISWVLFVFFFCKKQVILKMAEMDKV